MKVLSVKQPWAALLVNGIKDIENRTRRTTFRGRILIHASKAQKSGFIADFLTEEQAKAVLIFSVAALDCKMIKCYY